MRSPAASSTCRLEWRPSRWRAACVALAAMLAAVGLAASALPPDAGLAGGLGCLAWSLFRVHRDLRQAPLLVAWPGEGAPAELLREAGPLVLDPVNVRWRGTLATLEGRDPAGKLRRLAWWPDTLPPPARRALRLASDRRGAPVRVPLLST